MPPEQWVATATTARDEFGCDFFDWLSAVDELDEGFSVVAHVWSTTGRKGVLLRTRVPATDPSLPSIVEVYPGAAWHERETYEMFGIGFPGPTRAAAAATRVRGPPAAQEFHPGQPGRQAVAGREGAGRVARPQGAQAHHRCARPASPLQASGGRNRWTGLSWRCGSAPSPSPS